MIICFSGTGNSRYIADALAEKLCDEVVSLNDILKNDLSMEFESEKPYVIVCPIYAWRIAKPVDTFLSKAVFKGCKKVYVVATMGLNCGKADVYVAKTLAGKDVEFMGLTGIVMTDNYVVMSPMPDMATVEDTNRKALLALEPVAEKILNGEKIVKTDKTRFAGLKSGPVNNMFTKHMADAGYVISDSCTGCGKCVEFCPSNNVKIVDGKASIGKDCFCCYGCLHRCPQAAIDIKGKTEDKGRFVCPEYVPKTR